MSKSIRLSKKHGVNPSLMLCSWCGEPSGVALLGRLPNDKEAPREAVFDDVPCEKCEKGMARGITLIAAEIVDGKPKRTGAWWVITEDAARRMFEGHEAEETMRSKKAFIDSDMVEFLGLDVVGSTEAPNGVE